MKGYRVGIDIGGTFTDLVALDEDTGLITHHKILTTPSDPTKCFIEILERLDKPVKNISMIIHATTLGTNMFLGQVGLEPPKAALITNKGFIDVMEIGRQNRPELYNPFFTRPKPLIPRRLRIGVSGRLDHRGRELEPLDEDEIRRVARSLRKEADVIIVSMLHSYINPVHEKRIKEIILEEYPEAVVVASHEVDPQPREYERTVTTVVNAVLKPVLSRYLMRLNTLLSEKMFRGRFLVMKSSGGVASVGNAVEKPAAFIESGPAAGAVAVAYVSRLLGIENALGLDMGGTTAKASAVLGGKPHIVPEYEVGGKVHMGRLMKGSGYPLRIPHIDLAEVSSGGGTIAWVDEGGALRIGPLSAGADPGPVCYGRGGTQPTITDANLVLGRLPRVLGGGEIVLDRDAAYEAVKELGDQLGLEPVETALGIVKLSNQVMMRAIRLVSIERGHDPRMFTMFAFGGAGPLHAAELSEIGVEEVVIPPYPGVFSALGLLATDFRYEAVKSIVKEAIELDEEELNNIFLEISGHAVEKLVGDGVDKDRVTIIRYLDIMYWGQAYHLTTPYRGDIREAVLEFHEMHEARYGYSMRDEPVVIVSARVEALGILDKPSLPHSTMEEYYPRPVVEKDVYYEDRGWTATPVYLRSSLKPGAVLDGPSLIISDESTVLIPPEYHGYVDEYYAIHIRRR